MNARLGTSTALAATLALATLAVYAETGSFDFVVFDDPSYVLENVFIRRGLTRAGVVWAFTSEHVGNWHPLTGLSHMLDCTLFGLDAGGHHLTSVLLHVANTLVLFFALSGATGAPWRSGLVAALFALHPLHVESVAWVSGRKDVLSTFFGFAALGAYGRYARRGGLGRYALTTLLVGLGLMAKPMLVTLPFLFLLWDYWPLGRLRLRGMPDARSSAIPLARLVGEKLPFFVLSAATSVVTVVAQRHGEAVASLGEVPIGLRVANAIVSYARYLEKTIWPRDLSPVYPHPGLPGGTPLEPWQVAGAAFVLAALTAAVWASRRPYARMGWLWYLGTLVPVIGLVQVGGQAMADRYTYIPLVGPFIVAAWGAGDVVAALATHRARQAAAAAGTIVLTALALASRVQARHWRDSLALARLALRVAPRSPHMRMNLGIALQQAGKPERAIRQYRKAARIAPRSPKLHNNLGNALELQGRREQAIAHYRWALALDPSFARAHANLGSALLAAGETAPAIEHLETALRIEPSHHLAHERLGFALAAQGRLEEAIGHYRRALALEPDHAEAHNNLGIALQARGQEGDVDEAIAHLDRALEIRPRLASAHNNLGIALQARGDLDAAIAHYREALRLEPENAKAHNNLGITLQLQGDVDAAMREYREALRLQPDYPDAEYNLGLALQQRGDLRGAIERYRRTLALRPDYVKAHFNLALALEASGDGEGARRHLEEARRLDRRR
jgi:Flp pilus assembly protein TadD